MGGIFIAAASEGFVDFAELKKKKKKDFMGHENAMLATVSIGCPSCL